MLALPFGLATLCLGLSALGYHYIYLICMNLYVGTWDKPLNNTLYYHCVGLVDAQDFLALVCLCVVQYIMVCPMLLDCHQTMHCTIKLLLPTIGFVFALVICGMTAQCYLCAVKQYIEQSNCHYQQLLSSLHWCFVA